MNIKNGALLNITENMILSVHPDTFNFGKSAHFIVKHTCITVFNHFNFFIIEVAIISKANTYFNFLVEVLLSI